MKLDLNGIDVDCIIGERPEERVTPQRLRVDVTLEISDRVAETDELADTVDYAALTDRIRVALVAAKAKMIERAAKVVCETCLKDAKVAAVSAKVTKFGAIPHLESAAATFAFRRA